YQSSPAGSFVLSLFNVRLGWWLGNPGLEGDRTYHREGPLFALLPHLYETFGLTTDDRAYVYLSDGAHFENLALYEMVRRRCHFIILSDAGSDPDFSFDDLGNALRKIQIDLGVPIEFDDLAIRTLVKPDVLFAAQDEKIEAARKYYAVATIRYSVIDGGDPAKVDGKLLYIKPTVYGGEPPDVRNYAKANVPFPHETTG